MIEHSFQGNLVCVKCGEPKRKHRQPRRRQRSWHASKGDPCQRCGMPAAQHISESMVKAKQERNALRPDRYRGIPKPRERVIVGIDGEGKDLPDGRHIYTLLSAVDEYGVVVGEVENQNGLSAIECFGMLVNLPKHSLKFIFMGSYDWTKIIEDLHDTDIYYLMHPESRRVFTCKDCKTRWKVSLSRCPKCTGQNFRSIIKYRKILKDRRGNECKVLLDWFNGSFSVHNVRRTKKVKVWDCFKFFQSSFVKAIEAWDVGSKEQQARILEMKKKRGSFAEEKPEDVRNYCREECELLAKMMRKVLTACEKAGIKLARFDGAGAIANSMLKKNEVKKYMGPPLEEQPDGLYYAVMAAYFGGRFENSVVGAIEVPVYNRDIFSAYPYAISMLPCLECGKWKRCLQNVLENSCKATLAVVKYRIKNIINRDDIAWMPFPFRDEFGSICFPSGSIGWAWLPELEAGLKGWENYIEILEAWTYTTECEHKPFDWMPAYYRKRMEWGKDGPGIVMKLGCNACAGKTMQNAGDKPPFKSWIWGGMITATTRSQSLDAIYAASDRWNVLAIATDGVFSTEYLDLARAKDTGTYDLQKPLGNWGEEIHKNGVFFVKPGMYFDDAKSLMRARGIGREELDRIGVRIVEAFREWDRREPLKILARSRRFYGARSSVIMASECKVCDIRWVGWPGKLCPNCYQVGTQIRTQHMKLAGTEQSAYGRWDERTIKIEFACMPKREAIHDDGGVFSRMRIRDVGGAESTPYMGQTTPEGLEARIATEIGLEEPDWSDGQEELIE